MQLQRHVTSWVAFSAILVSGCTSQQLRKDTINQMATVHDLQQQQVLDNLAMFVQNRNAYPYFSLVVGGTCSLSDSGSLAVPNGFARTTAGFVYTTLGINPSVSRNLQENWQINPINDSVKLTLMRCVYQRAVAGCFGEAESEDCPNCETLYDAFYGALKPPVITFVYPSGKDGLPGIIHSKTWVVIWGKHLSGARVLIGGVPAFPPSPAAKNPTTTDTNSSAPPASNDSQIVVIPPTDFNELVESESHEALEAKKKMEQGTKVVDLTVLTGAGQVTIPAAFAYAPMYAAASGGGGGGGGSLSPTPHAIGIITPDRLTFCSNWFCCGQKHHVPQNHPCNLVGHYCDTYVWVPPCGVNELTKLTIMIQDIAYYDFSNSTVVGSAGAIPGITGVAGRPITPQFPPLLLDATTLRTFTPPPQTPPGS